MTKMFLKGFEKKIRVRPMRIEDYEDLAALQLKCFPGMKPWLKEQIQSQLALFPEGQVVVELQGRLVASSTSLIVDFSEHREWHEWRTISDNGYIRNHDPEGDTLYGIEIMVDPEFRGMRLARRLYEERKKIAIRRNLARIMIGGRIPGYHAHADKLSAKQYVERVVDKKLVDPVLTAQLANDFVIKGLIKDYMPADKESCGYATFLEWANLEHVADKAKKFIEVRRVRISTVQYQMRAIKSFAEFERQVRFFVDVASDYKADFVVFPELFTTQLLSLVKAERPGLAARALAEYAPRIIEMFQSMSLKYNVNIIGGSTFVIEEDGLYNVAHLYRRDGTLGRQYKIHITPNERRWWGVQPGHKIKVFDTDRGKVAILICYDVEFPEAARIAVEQGAQIIFVPFNTDNRQGYLRVRTCAQARCIENHVYTAISGCVGNMPQVDNVDIHYAQSGVFTPCDFPFSREGVAGECNPNIETIVTCDVDTEVLRRHRLEGTVQNWNDRRQDLYTIEYTPKQLPDRDLKESEKP